MPTESDDQIMSEAELRKHQWIQQLGDAYSTELQPNSYRTRNRRRTKTTTRDMVRIREHGRCAKCGQKPARNTPSSKNRGTIHHRLPQREGTLDTLANLVLLCRPCHDSVHRDESLATKYGLVVPPGVDPLDVPMFHVLLGWVLLDDDGVAHSIDWQLASSLLWDLHATRWGCEAG